MKLMRLLLICALAFLGAVFLAQVAEYDTGFVAFGYADWVVQASLTAFLVALLVSMAALYFLVRMLLRVVRMPGSVADWRSRRRHRRAEQALYGGYLAMAEGEWRKAERLLIGHAGSSETPLIHYLGAARAAQQLDAADRRDNYLRQAHEQVPDADLAVGLVQAELQISQAQQEQALATLAHLRELSPGNHQVLKLLLRLRQQLHEWDKLLDLLPEMKRRGILRAEQHDACEREAWQGILNDSGDAGVLQKNWKRLPKRYQTDAGMLACFASLCIDLDAGDAAEPLLKAAIKKEHEPRLIALYGQIESSDPERQLHTAEAWLTGHEDDAVLLLALGRLCIRNQLWGKAQEYLQRAVDQYPSPVAYHLLARVQEELGDGPGAAGSFRKGLELVTTSGQRPQGLPSPG